MQRWTPMAGCLEHAEGTHITWADHCVEVTRLKAERDNAEKREFEVLGRANALAAELKATQARLDVSDNLLREEFAQKQDALAALKQANDNAERFEREWYLRGDALESIAEMTDADNPESYRCDDREGCLDTVFATATAALPCLRA